MPNGTRGVPLDKEKAIVDALQHFQIINSERMEAAQNPVLFPSAIMDSFIIEAAARNNSLQGLRCRSLLCRKPVFAGKMLQLRILL